MKTLPFEVNIKSADNAGYIVNVSCQTLVFTDAAELIVKLTEYLNDPDEAFKKHRESKDARRASVSEPQLVNGMLAHPSGIGARTNPVTEQF